MSPRRGYLPPLLNLIHLPRRLGSVASIVATTFALFALLFFALSGPLRAAAIQPVDPSASRLQAPPNCVEQIVNGGFEQTGVGWNSVAGASLFTYATDQFAGGRRSLLLGVTASPNVTATFGVEQLLLLPADSTSIAFSFAYQVDVTGPSDPGDQAYLTIYDANTDQLLAMLVLSPTTGAWSTGRYDLTPLAGKNIRLAFSAQNDGEPGRLAMRVDDVSILACLPLKDFALQPLPTPAPTATPVIPPALILTPLPSPQPSATIPPAAMAPANVPPANMPSVTTTVAPAQSQAQSGSQNSGTIVPGSISSLDQCSCASSLYTCSDFSSWSVAQACFTHCQVTAGYDIHNLDQDRDGIACELELQDVASLTDTSAPQSMPSAITQTSSLSPGIPSNTGVAVGSVTTTITSQAQLSSTNNSILPETAPPIVTSTTTISTSATTQTTTISSTGTVSGTVTSSSSVSGATSLQNAPPLATPADASGSASTNAPDSAATLSSTQLLSLFLFSPLGYAAILVLAVLGGLGLWLAYLLGRRGGQSNVKQPADVKSGPDDFALKPNKDVSSPKS